MWIDSHCHLTHEKMSSLGAPEGLIKNARKHGVSGVLNVCCLISEDFAALLEISRKFESVWCSVGTQPHDAGNLEEIKITKDRIVELANSDPNVIAIGETGLDYHYNFSTKEDQINNFRKHLQAAVEADVPVIIHAREADEDIVKIVKEEGAGAKLTGVMHSFSSSCKLAEEMLDLGFYISFSGMVTFKKSDELREIAKDIPLDRILIETDAPRLAPEPLRGKVNQPSYVAHTGRMLAEIHNISEKNFADQSTQNFFRLFTKASV